MKKVGELKTHINKRDFFIVINIFLCFLGLSQKQANIWHFGDHNCIDFNSSSPKIVYGSSISTIAGCASYCDTNGRLLFYSNGGGKNDLSLKGGIWNKMNKLLSEIPDTCGGGASAVQSSVFIEAPGEDSVYYLFTMEQFDFYLNPLPQFPSGKGLCYYKIDLRLNYGLGKVVESNKEVFKPSYEGLCAIRHVNKSDYWIIINHPCSKFGVYRVDSTGVFFKSEYFFANQNDVRITASPDGKKVIGMNVIMDFDNENGILSKGEFLANTENGNFSPNSDYLYVFKDSDRFNKKQIVRYNLNEKDLMNSIEIIGEVDWLNLRTEKEENTAMQLGPDGNIYFGLNDFARIKCANSSFPQIERNVLKLNFSENFNWSGFPNFPAWIFEKEDNYSIKVDSLNIDKGEYQLLTTGGESYTWQPSEGLSCSDCPNPIASPIISTKYTVLISDKNGCGIEKGIQVNAE